MRPWNGIAVQDSVKEAAESQRGGLQKAEVRRQEFSLVVKCTRSIRSTIYTKLTTGREL